MLGVYSLLVYMISKLTRAEKKVCASSALALEAAAHVVHAQQLFDVDLWGSRKGGGTGRPRGAGGVLHVGGRAVVGS